MRCDLHLHSNASVGNEEWYTRLFGCPESFADPVRQYDLCKQRGMSLVTLTDHDTIAGGLKLLDRPDFFLSEEVTARFPDDSCVVHVLAWNISPDQHEAIASRRANIFQLVDYLNQQDIVHALAHPLHSPSGRLSADSLERLLLLFPVLEAPNGLTDRRIEGDLTTLLGGLDAPALARLAGKHGISARGDAPHRKRFTAGSDDHVQRRGGTVYTEVDGEGLTPAAFLRRCQQGQARVVGRQAHIDAMALSVKNTAYHHLKQRQTDRRDDGDPFVDMIDVIAGRSSAAGERGAAGGFIASLLAGAQQAQLRRGQHLDILSAPEASPDEDDARIVASIARLSDTVIEEAGKGLLAGAEDFDLYKVFGALRDLAGGLVTAAPVFFAADHFGKQDRQVRQLWEQWTAWPLPGRRQHLALFTDSLEQVDGVSIWCKRFLEQARAEGRKVSVPYCGELAPHFAECPSFQPLPSAMNFRLPLYARLRFHVPSLIETLRWVWSQGISHLELSTPGPMGLVGLLVAKVLHLPVTASYHTEVPALVESLGGGSALTREVRRYLGWFYRSVDRVFVFSPKSRQALADMDVPDSAISLMPTAIDPEEFSPAHRCNTIFRSLNVDVDGRPVILSVGRLSGEKNIPMMIEAVERLQQRPARPLLLIAGDGPERTRLEASAHRKDFVHFVGLQHGDALKKLYASAKMFVFASRIDTLGLVNMEAMSSGLPVLVPTEAGIADFTCDESAERYLFGVDGLTRAITRVLDDPSRADQLASNGRRAMLRRWHQTSFSSSWDLLTQRN